MSEPPPIDPTSPTFVPVCAIGASAGGVGALQTLFRLLPGDLGLAYVVVIHLSPDHPSALEEILGACTKMPVHQVTDGPKLRANCVYVIAPDSELVIDGDDVRSRPFSDPRGRRAPIDMFFRSIAAGRGDGIAVVLTGAGSDGAVGVRAIKEAGGIVMVQEPAEAGFPSMPQNAIATGVADVVAPLARLAERIAEAAHSKEAVRSLDEDGAANDIRRIVAFLRTRTGHDFSGYKRSTVLRRIQRRMQVCQIANPAEYAQYLRANPEEARELLADLLISVTMFFRDPEAFITLSHRVIRPLMEARSTGDAESELRAWVVGCATGEEAYSLAILLLEEAEQLKVTVPIQIFATDLDDGALATAREGRYPRSIEADVSADRLQRFFVDEGTHYRIDRKVRDLVLFAVHSVVREPPFMRLDLITCRNVLIYLERALQQHVTTIFRYGLKPDGYLFLGSAETADTSDNQFAAVDRDARIYRALPSRPDFVPNLAMPAAWSAGRPALTESRLAVSQLDAGEILGESHAAALEASAPPSALVDAVLGALHLSPTAGRFILLSAGPLSSRLPSIVRPELRLDLKLALDRAFDAQQPSITRPIEVAMEGETRRVSLHVAPLPAGVGAAPRAVVYFLDSGPGRPEGAELPALPFDELRHLHSELKVAQEAELAGRIRNESAVQELRASNEELQSLNEEYRSTAEELETSKEELQSINEELQTVNAELKSKLGVISAAHNDLKNLTASSEIGTLFLDLDLRIRMFTPRVAELISVTDADVGRSITNFTHRLEYDGLAADIRRVLRELVPLETEARTADGRWFLVRIRPYRTIDGKVEGAVGTFDDITIRKEAEAVVAEELRNTAILQHLGARLVTEDNIRTVYEDILTAAIEITRAKAGTVQMLDAEAGELVVIATRGFSPRTMQYFHRIDAESNTSCGLALRTGNRSYVNFDPAGADEATRLHVEDGVLSAQSSPLTSRGGKPIGLVSTHWGELDHHPSERELRFLDLLLRQAADLIEQRQAEIALHEGETRYRTMFQAMNEGYLLADIICDDQGRPADIEYLEANPAATRIFGIDLTGRRLRDLDPEYEEYWYEIFGRVALTGHGERGIQYAKPGDIWYDYNVSKVVPSDPASRRIALRFSDASFRIKAERALRESEARFRTLAETAPALIWQNGADGENLFVNRYYLDYTGLSADKIGGEKWRALIHPGDAEAYVADYMAAVRGQRPFRNRNRIRRYDGAWRWFENYAQPLLDEQGSYQGHVGISTDVTAIAEAELSLRASERWQQTLVEGVSQLVWRAIDDGYWTWASPQWTSYTGQTEPDSHGYGWLGPLHPDDREAVRAAWAGATERGEFYAECRIRNAAQDRYRWFQARATPVRNSRGDIIEWLGTSTDVDDLRQLQGRQQVLVAELQHRTFNLMGMVRSTADATIRSSASLEEFKPKFRDRIDALARVQRLLSRVTDEDRVSFDELIQGELAAVGALQDEDSRVVLEGPQGVALRSSTVQTFAMALHELTTNAVKYGALSQPGASLAVRWRVEDGEDGETWLHMDWRETGLSMPPDGQAARGTGQGRTLIEKALPYQLRAKTEYVLTAEGVRCSIALPVSARAAEPSQAVS